MRHIIKKFFWTWDFEKEEKWLNEMAAKGLGLISVGFGKYEFEDTLPGEYTIRIQFLENSNKHPETQKFIGFVEETGAEQVGYFYRWIYFRKKTADGPFNLFSDFDSRIKHLKRLITLIAVLAAANFLVGAFNIFWFFSFDSWLNAVGFINIFLGAWSIWGIYLFVKRKKKLEREKQIYE